MSETRAEDHGSWQFATKPSRVTPFPLRSVVNPGVEVHYTDDAGAGLQNQ